MSDLCAGLIGGLGVTPGANIGHDSAVFEAVHGSAPDIAGQNLANPVALLRSGVMMLEHLELFEEAGRIETAIEDALSRQQIRTRDLGGTAGTTELTEALVRSIEGS